MADESRINIGDLKPGDVALLRDLAEASAEKAVAKTLTAMGLDTSNPLRSQRDFTFLRQVTHDEEFAADLDFLRRTRKRSEGAWGKATAAAITAGVVGFMQFLWNIIQPLIGKH